MIDPDRGEPMASAALRDNLATLVAESQALRTDVAQAEAARRRANQVNAVLLALVAVFTALMLIIGWQNNRLASKVNATNQTMADCTNPGGTCYEQNRRNTQSAISDILRVSIYMAECSRLYPGEAGPTYDRKLEACIYQRLEDGQRTVPGGTVPGGPIPSPSPSLR